MDKVTFAAVGDVFMTRRLPEKRYKGFDELKALIESHDVKFANLEITVHRREGYPGAFSGGTWAMTAPEAMDDLKDYGFNIYNAANNHSMDYSHNGLLATMRHLTERDMNFAGIGENLGDASAPAFVECPEGRVAVVAASSSYHESWMAGDSRPDMMGRPGLNHLRNNTVFHVTSEHMKALEEIAEATLINDQRNASIKEGFAIKEDGFMFGNYKFVEDEKEYKETTVNKTDMDRIIASIKDAKLLSDYVCVSIHSHQMGFARKDYPADFLREFAHKCIDAGAIAILGHGPHIMRGIEVYNGGIIFYSLGDFLFQNDTPSHEPSDFFTKYSLGSSDRVGTALNKRSKNNTIGLGVNPEVWRSVVASFTAENGKLTEVKLHPIEMGFDLPSYRKGLPALSRDEDTIRRMAELSSEFGTEISFENGVGIVKL